MENTDIINPVVCESLDSTSDLTETFGDGYHQPPVATNQIEPTDDVSHTFPNSSNDDSLNHEANNVQSTYSKENLLQNIDELIITSDVKNRSLTDVAKDLSFMNLNSDTSPKEVTAKDISSSDLESDAPKNEKDSELEVSGNQPSSLEDDSWDWKQKSVNVFVLSPAGKPIYMRYGNENSIASLYGVLHALTSVVADNDDQLREIRSKRKRWYFMKKDALLLVCATGEHCPRSNQVQLQLHYIYNQILSVLTLPQITRIFKEHENYDLRKSLCGSERLLDSFMDFTENEPSFLFKGIECLPLMPSCRHAISQTIVNYCSKIKNLVFVIMIGANQLITMVRMKKYTLPYSDLHIIMNLISSTTSFLNFEQWIPLCLPALDSSGCLQLHVSYVNEDCHACILMLTIDRDIFYELSRAKQVIAQKLSNDGIIVELNKALHNPHVKTSKLDVSNHLRHFAYKNLATSQFVYAECEMPYNQPEEAIKLLNVYKEVEHTVDEGKLKFIFRKSSTEIATCSRAKNYELYMVFEPFTTKKEVQLATQKILKAMRKENDYLFIPNFPTF